MFGFHVVLMVSNELWLQKHLFYAIVNFVLFLIPVIRYTKNSSLGCRD